MTSPLASKRRIILAISLVIVGIFGVCALILLTVNKVATENKPYLIPSESMSPTLKVRSVHLANLNAYREAAPKFGDIVVYRAPEAAQRDPNSKLTSVSRCIGLPGDVIEIRNGDLYRNGRVVQEPYVLNKPTVDFKLVSYKGTPFPIQNEGGLQFFATADKYHLENATDFEAALKLPAIAVPKGSLIVMGDNRPGAFDSRCWGLLPIANVIGQITDAK